MEKLYKSECPKWFTYSNRFSSSALLIIWRGLLMSKLRALMPTLVLILFILSPYLNQLIRGIINNRLNINYNACFLLHLYSF
jgi:hypothetical protein